MSRLMREEISLELRSSLLNGNTVVMDSRQSRSGSSTTNGFVKSGRGEAGRMSRVSVDAKRKTSSIITNSGLDGSLKMTVRILQVSSMLPTAVYATGKAATCLNILLICFSLVWVFVNLVLFSVTSIVSYVHIVCYGIWHPMTMQAIVSGLKPLQCLANLLLMMACRKSQASLIRQITRLGASMQKLTKVSKLGYKRVNLSLLALVLVILISLETLRIGNVFVVKAIMEQKRAAYWAAKAAATAFAANASQALHDVTTDIVPNNSSMTSRRLPPPNALNLAFRMLMMYLEKLSYVILPAFGVWQLLPLAYFSSITFLARRWLQVGDVELYRIVNATDL